MANASKSLLILGACSQVTARDWRKNYLGTNSELHQAMINIILWEMRNLKWSNPYNLYVCVNWRWANNHYKDHVALSYMLAFQRRCNLRQKQVFQCTQSTQLKSIFFMRSLVPSDWCFKELGNQKESKSQGEMQINLQQITSQVPRKENFIASDIQFSYHWCYLLYG